MTFFLSNRNIQVLALIGACCGWILLLLLSIREQYAIFTTPSPEALPLYVKGLALNLFIGGIYAFGSVEVRRQELDFQKMLWKLFVTAFVCALVSILVSIILEYFHDDRFALHPYWYSTFFHFEFGALIVVLVMAFVTWKRMILYEKGIFVQRAWTLFEVFLGLALMSHFFRIGIIDIYFNVPYALLVIWMLVLSVNVKWIPLLNFNQKIAGILQVVFILLCLAYFANSLQFYFEKDFFLADDLLKNVFATGLYTFIVIYGVITVLFMLFNLPTSSVYDKRIEEIAVFRQLSSTVTERKSEKEIYKVLFDAAVSTVKADAAWLEMHDGSILMIEGILPKEAELLRRETEQAGFDGMQPKNISYNPYFGKGRRKQYHSVMVIPVLSEDRFFGTIYLLCHIHNAFDKMMLQSITSYANQASIALYNLELMSQIVEGEVWKKNIEIAKTVQERLIPKRWESGDEMEMIVISESAIEVGGDYYDYHKSEEGLFSMIIADVAGKGIKAAFNMAQMKGIFQTLVRMHLSPSELIFRANNALSGCLERSAFITATYYNIDTRQKLISFARAGHCPTLYYQKKEDKAFYFEDKGLGLGILRDESYKQFIMPQEWRYEEGDVMILYTDGIVEAQREDSREQFGYDRLRDFLQQNNSLPVKEICDKLFEEIFDFLGERRLQDDFTLIVIRF
ncbi:GAF domain-containing SpoIIE family protein phosphatase [Limibacter armeniacum]|uniref:GAF domain-containing SpoIIE family protein phosphatase n=1 Tax=Limibacter armeniacum TaxID=466084 RepID=UPI002FE683BD